MKRILCFLIASLGVSACFASFTANIYLGDPAPILMHHYPAQPFATEIVVMHGRPYYMDYYYEEYPDHYYVRPHRHRKAKPKPKRHKTHVSSYHYEYYED